MNNPGFDDAAGPQDEKSSPRGDEIDGERQAGCLVSVVIPAYNAEKTITETLDGVLAQTFPSFEVIIVNDGSADGTAAILDDYARRFAPRVKVFHQKNTGQARARNNGIAKAQGEFIALVDADDLWAPTKLERQVSYLNAHPEAGLCYTEGMTIDGDGQEIEPFGATAEFTGRCFEVLISKNNIVASSVMVRKSVLDDVGVFNPDLRACENWELWTRVARKYELAFVDEKLSFYRQHDGNMSRNIDHMRENRLVAIRHNHTQYKGLVSNIDSLTRDAFYTAYAGFASVYLGQFQLSKARRDLWRAIRLRPFVLRNYGWLVQTFLGKTILKILRAVKGGLSRIGRKP